MTVTKDDFEKVWASTSPLTPYAFSDAKYKEGWNFVGSTPPSRQMWDYLQKNNDEKSQYLLNNFDNYLPLSGGTMTGDITLADGGNPLSTSGGTMTGAIKGNPVTLTAESGGDSSSLVLGADGSMTLDGQNVVTAPNGEFIKFISFSLNGSVAANNWGDYSATIPFPSGYSHVVGVTRINVPSPAAMKLAAFWQINNNFTVRVYSTAAISSTIDVTLSVCK